MKVFVKEPLAFACASSVREANFSSGSEIVIVTSVSALKPSPESVTSSAAW